MKKKCNTQVCMAMCCYNVPMGNVFLKMHEKDMITKPVDYYDVSVDPVNGRADVIPVTNPNPELNKCPFLREDYNCNIYNDRPNICRMFGDPKYYNKSPFLHCPHIKM